MADTTVRRCHLCGRVCGESAWCWLGKYFCDRGCLWSYQEDR